MQQSLFKGRDRRKKGWFWMDNEYLNGYGKYFGPIGTSVYLSLCRHADNETQQCFPAIKTIAEEIGASENTVVKYIKMFEQYRLISIERDKDTVTKRQLNNIYTLLDKEEWLRPESPLWKKSRPQRLRSDSRPQPLSEPTAMVEKSRPQPLRYKETHREGDSIKETAVAETSSAGADSSEIPFDFDAYLESMRTDQQRHIQIIGRFFHAKGLTFDNLKQVQAAVKRHLRAARDLAAFSNQQIDQAITKVERQYSDIEWTLETLLKVLTK